jgi:drug/metabolite transporter (DMT)-like permease
MSPLAVLLVGLSAILHASWNLMGKRQNPTAAFFFVSSLFATLLTLPFILYARQALGSIPGLVWLLLVLTGACQAVYYIGLAGAYRTGDMSVAYPLVRALPVILVAALSAALGIGKPLSGLGVTGILLVAVGCLIIPLRSFHGISARSYLNACCLLAALAALGTCGYTLIDNEALRQLRLLPGMSMGNAGITVLFMALENITTTIALAGYVLLLPAERSRLAFTWRRNRLNAALTGALITGTYGLVLLAMAYASNVSYIAAFRQLSIPLGAVLGIVVQKEAAHRPKLAGIGIVFAGLILIGLA